MLRFQPLDPIYDVLAGVVPLGPATGVGAHKAQCLQDLRGVGGELLQHLERALISDDHHLGWWMEAGTEEIPGLRQHPIAIERVEILVVDV